jgi:glycosyltransferase involved in cell wall biosynthesis
MQPSAKLRADPAQPAGGARTLRILHVVNHTRRQNGNVHAAVDVACAEAALGHEVAMCSSGGEFDPVLRANDVAVEVVPELARADTAVQAAVRLRRLVAARRVDIVHAHMMRSAGLSWAATRLSPARLVTTVHNAFDSAAILMALGDRVIAVSGAVSDGMRRRGVPAGRLRMVLNGTLGTARHAYEPPPTPKALARPAALCVAGLHPRKGILDLLAGFSQARRARPELHLYLVGGGPCEAEYRAAAESDRDYVHFCGPLTDPRPYMLGADVLVLASHADPAPLVIPEAREAGLAVIATRVDGIPELLEGGRAGVLVAPHAPDEIAAALLAVLADERSLAEHRARSQINLERMSLRRVAQETLAVYAELQRPQPRLPLTPDEQASLLSG